MQNDVLSSMKRIALNAVDNSKPVEIIIGTIASTSPLKVKLSQKLIIDRSNLIVANSIDNLQINDSVIILRVQGGQKFVVIDKVKEGYL